MPIDALNKLCKWRSVLVGWITGTRAVGESGVKGLRDLVDRSLIVKVETNALAALLIKKGIFTAEEYTRHVNAEAMIMDEKLSERFPGFRTTGDGVVIFDIERAQKTMRELGFPP